MRKTLSVFLVVALVLSLPLIASAHSWAPKTVTFAVVACAESSGAITVAAVSESASLPAIAAGADCATSLATLIGAGVNIVNVTTQAPNGWVYTLSNTPPSD